MNRVAQFDIKVGRAIRSWPKSLGGLMTAVSFLGSGTSTIGIGLIAAEIAWQHSQKRLAQAFILALLACGMNEILKLFVRRPRPDSIYVSNMRFYTYSFPSGHSFSSLLIYGLLAAEATSRLSELGALIYLLAVLLILSIGASRVYLEAHYPTDVIAGWVLSSLVLVTLLFYANS